MRKFLILICFCSILALHSQDFDIKKFSDPEKYGWKSNQQRLDFRQRLNVNRDMYQLYNLQRQSVSSNLAKSALFPGWGQFSAKKYTNGQIMISLNIILLGSALYFYDQAMINYDKYKSATQIELMNKYYSDAKTPYGYARLITGLWLMLWSYNLYDTVISTQEYNAKVWERIVKQHSKKVLLTPTGISIKF